MHFHVPRLFGPSHMLAQQYHTSEHGAVLLVVIWGLLGTATTLLVSRVYPDIFASELGASALIQGPIAASH